MLGILKEEQDVKRTAKAAMYNTAANLVAMLVGIVMIPIISRNLSTEDMGIAVSFITIRNISLYIFTLASYSAIYKAMIDYEKEKNAFLSSIFLFNTMLIVVFFILGMGFKNHIKGIVNDNTFLVYWLFISSYFVMVKEIGVNYLLFHNCYILIAVITILGGPLSQLISIWFIEILNDKKYIGRIVGMDTLTCIIGIIASILIIWKGKMKLQWKYIRYALNISLPLIMHLISQTILTQCDILMITYFEGTSKTGVYSMAYTIGTLAYTVLLQIMSVWSPWVYRQLAVNKTQQIYRYSGILFGLGGILVVSLMTIAPEVVSLVLDEGYSESVYIIPSIVLGMFFQFLYLFFYDIEYFNKKTKYIAKSSAIAAMLNILLNMIFIPELGYMVAGYTTAISYLTLSIMHYIYMKKIDDRRIYNDKLIILISIIITTTTFLNILFSGNILIRYAIWGIVCLTIVIIFRGEFEKLRRSIKK